MTEASELLAAPPGTPPFLSASRLALSLLLSASSLPPLSSSLSLEWRARGPRASAERSASCRSSRPTARSLDLARDLGVGGRRVVRRTVEGAPPGFTRRGGRAGASVQRRRQAQSARRRLEPTTPRHGAGAFDLLERSPSAPRCGPAPGVASRVAVGGVSCWRSAPSRDRGVGPCPSRSASLVWRVLPHPSLAARAPASRVGLLRRRTPPHARGARTSSGCPTVPPTSRLPLPGRSLEYDAGSYPCSRARLPMDISKTYASAYLRIPSPRVATHQQLALRAVPSDRVRIP